MSNLKIDIGSEYRINFLIEKKFFNIKKGGFIIERSLFVDKLFLLLFTFYYSMPTITVYNMNDMLPFISLH